MISEMNQMTFHFLATGDKYILTLISPEGHSYSQANFLYFFTKISDFFYNPISKAMKIFLYMIYLNQLFCNLQITLNLNVMELKERSRFSMSTTSDNREFLDCFSLFDTLESSDYKWKEMKDFLAYKFNISFNEISKNISYNTKNSDNVINSIYDSVNLCAFGYSLDTFCDTTYREYSYGDCLLNANQSLLEKCNEQIKYYCLISSLYTIYAIYNKDNYKRLFEVAINYSDKKYLTLDKKNILSTQFYFGYEKGNHKIEERIRSAYDLLCTSSKSKKSNKENIKQEKLLFTDEYLKKAFNYKEDRFRLINEFLDEFSFDLIVNQMQGGFHLLSKIKTLQKYRGEKSSNFRRETIRFMNGLKIIDKNFYPSKSNEIESLLYYWKRESLFHINIFKYLTNTKENKVLLKHASDLLAFPTLISLEPFTFLFEQILHMDNHVKNFKFIIKYLSEITFPVYTYTFFIALCEYFHYSLEDIRKELNNYIETLSIKMELSDTLSLNTDSLQRENADNLGEAILDTFINGIRLPYFDNSFKINLDYINSDGIPFFIEQSSLGFSYYINMLQ